MLIRIGHVSLLPTALMLSLAAMNSALARRLPQPPTLEPSSNWRAASSARSAAMIEPTRHGWSKFCCAALHSRMPALLFSICISQRTGEVVFVVDDTGNDGQLQRAEAGEFPLAGDMIRATVRDAGHGVWSASGSDWFDSIESTRSPVDRDVAGNGNSGSQNQFIDPRYRCEPKVVRGRIGLQVAQVQSEGPAHDTAGFQVGDVIVAVGGNPISSTASVQQLALEAKPLELSVVDVNSGRLAEVTLAPSPTGRTGLPSRTDEPRRETDYDAATRRSCKHHRHRGRGHTSRSWGAVKSLDG